MIPTPPIITTDRWGAKPPRGRIVHAGRPRRIIFHHTAGHHPELDAGGTSQREDFAYARAIQRFHFSEGWIDSGHNFLVCRSGRILVGRHETLLALLEGRMVVSAHCPGQNDQPGIEHEHNGLEAMTPAQFDASAWLHAWIIARCGMRATGTIQPHGHYFPTSCPGVLERELPELRREVVRILNHGGPL